MRKRNLTKRFAAGFMAAALVVSNVGLTANAEDVAVEVTEDVVESEVTEEETVKEQITEETIEEQTTEEEKNEEQTTTEEQETTETEEIAVAAESDEEVETGISEVVLTVGATENEVNLTWYTENNASYVQFAKADEAFETDGTFPNEYKQSKAKTTASFIDGFYSNSITLSELEEGTTYVYRVSGVDAEGNMVWSDCYEYEVKDVSNGYEFLVVGDPQIGSSNTETDTTNWSATMQTATSQFANASLLLSVGDQINSARNNDTKAEQNFIGFLSEETGLSSLPLASSVGNHDNSHVSLYTSHFTLPNVSTYGNTNDAVAGEEDYYFTYGNTLFMMINTNNSSIAEHKAFIEETIADNTDCTWKVVAFHQSIYSVASHVNDGNIADLRVGLSPVFAQNNIDIVLMGHDHVYARSYIMGGVTGMQANVTETVETEITDPNGVQYITFNSGSGSKYYNITSELYEYTAVQNQEKTPNYSHVTVTDNSFEVTTYRTSDNSVVDTVTIYKTNNDPDVLTDTVKIVDTTKTLEAETKTEGYKNGEAELSVAKVAGYDSGVVNEDGGSAEIVQYNSDTQMYYVVNGTTGTLDIVPRATYEASGATGVKCDLKGELAELRPDFEYGDMTSVAISTESDLVAIAIQAAGTADEGLIVLMNYENEVVAVIGAGVQPDMVTFTEDGTKVLSANEGEPRDGYAVESDEDSTGNSGFPGFGGQQKGTVDPAGTVTIADLNAGVANITTQEVTFEAYDTEEARAALVNAGVILKKDTDPSVDFEPEYIAVSGNTAYVTLQEANAIAVIDITSGTVTAVNSLGFKDHNLEENALDLADDGEIKLETANVYGIYMPDAVSVYEVNGKTYVVTANEGDAREWGEEDSEEYHCNEAKTKDINGKKVTIFDKTEYEGLDEDKTYIFGGRSFAIYEMQADGSMIQVYESGSDFETVTAEVLPEVFNCSNNDVELDSRSGKKGPESESVTVGEVNGKTYAFVGLERIGGIMIYDITDPANATYVNYINSRDFSSDIAGDVSPEGLTFVPAALSVSGNAEIIVAHEVSGTVGIYELTTLSDDGDDTEKDDGSENLPGNNDQNDNTVEDTKETTNKTEGTETVNTGDVQNPMLWAIVMAVAINLLAAAGLIRRKAK